MPTKGIGPAPAVRLLMIEIYDRDLSQAVAHHSRHSADELLNGKAHLNDIAASDAPVTVPSRLRMARAAATPEASLCFPDWCHPRRGSSFLNKNSYPSQ